MVFARLELTGAGKASEMFSVEIQISPLASAGMPENWLKICTSEGLDEATAICKRAAMSEKVTCRVLEPYVAMTGVPLQKIAYEEFYNQDSDPDHYERDDEDWGGGFHENDVNLRWQEVGF